MLTAEQAQAQLPGNQQHWQIPRLEDVVARVAEENKVYIYNVSPKMWIRYQGGMGTFVIRGCEPGKRYSEPCVLKGVITETNPVDFGVMTLKQYDGYKVAQDIVGVGSFRESNDDLTKQGVFLSRTNPPTEEEIAQAESALADHDSYLVAEANRLYENNAGVDPKSGMSNIGQHHIDAAKRLGLNPAWTRKATRLMECPACGESVRPNAAMCSHCDAVLDEEKARKFFPHKFAGKPGRPKAQVAETEEAAA